MAVAGARTFPFHEGALSRSRGFACKTRVKNADSIGKPCQESVLVVQATDFAWKICAETSADGALTSEVPKTMLRATSERAGTG
jgi:hypothetical protein